MVKFFTAVKKILFIYVLGQQSIFYAILFDCLSAFAE